ncbi:uncharacterized protein [Linepithema humile]|uniref:uncharacterized protein isoform X2 n=1 Tax=Linepithema humile TaxID=83485 RepID=UPI00351F3B29
MVSNLENQNDNHMDYRIDNATTDKRYELAEAKNAMKYKKHVVKNMKHFTNQHTKSNNEWTPNNDEWTSNNDEWTDKEYEHTIENMKTYIPKLPNSLLFFISAALHRGDCGRSATDRPLWLDMDMFQRGQKFAREHIFSIFLANMLSLFQLFTFIDGLKPMILSRQSHTPYLAFRRMHRAIRLKLCEYDQEELDAATKIPNPWCPDRKTILEDFSSCPYPTVANGCLHLLLKPTGLNQADMAATQFAFMGIILLYPHELGVHVSDEDMIAFCHLWRGIGYLLGIEDEYNFCRGSLEEIKQRGRDFTETWVRPYLRQVTPEWEHMLRCLVKGTNYYMPNSLAFNQILLLFADLLSINMPHMRKTLTYFQRLQLMLLRFILHYGMKIQFVRKYVNRRVLKSLDKVTKFDREKHKTLKKRSAQKVPDFFCDS